jgi:two-component system NtrC family sensor kinase
MKKIKVLVFDDNQEFCRNLKDILEMKEYTVEIAYDGLSALELVGNDIFDLVLMDIKMPGMDGIALYNHIKNISLALAGRIIFITGDILGDRTMEFLSETGIPCLSKPFDAGKLKEAVNSLLHEK